MNYRRRELARHAGVHVRLTGYGAASDMSEHSHDYHQISFLLAGAVRERHAGREIETDLPSLCVKPAGFDHANDYGRDGAVILALNIDPDSELAAGIGETWRWQAHRPDRAVHALIDLLDDPDGDAREAVTDLLALNEIPGKSGPAPDWLVQLRGRLQDPEDAVEFAEMASELGVHRVQASRAFVQHFAIPPSLYRARCRLGRALGLLRQSRQLAWVAAEAGFADQAHLCRTMKRHTGQSPSALRRLLQAA